MTKKNPSERKEEIRKAAVQVISNLGFHKTTTDKIAEAAGLSVGTIYNYFEDKEEILSYIFEVEREKLKSFFSDLNDSAQSPAKKLRLLLDRHFEMALENKKESKLLIDHRQMPVRKVSVEILDYSILLKSCFQSILEEGIASGGVRDDLDPELISGMIIGAADSVVVKSFFTDESPDEIFKGVSERIIRALLHGILSSKNQQV